MLRRTQKWVLPDPVGLAGDCHSPFSSSRELMTLIVKYITIVSVGGMPHI